MTSNPLDSDFWSEVKLCASKISPVLVLSRATRVYCFLTVFRAVSNYCSFASLTKEPEMILLQNYFVATHGHRTVSSL